MQLQSWLNNPSSFEMGLRLLDKFCPNEHSSFKRHAKKYGANDFYKKKLFTVLKEANNKQVVQEKPVSKPKIKRHLKVDRNNLPTDLQDLYDKRLALYKKAAHWHGRYLLLSEKNRELAVVTIIDCRKKINAIWDQLDHYTITGERKGAIPASTQSESFNALKRLQTLRTYKSKYRLAPHKFEKYQEEFDKLNKIVEKAPQL